MEGRQPIRRFKVGMLESGLAGRLFGPNSQSGLLRYEGDTMSRWPEQLCG